MQPNAGRVFFWGIKHVWVLAQKICFFAKFCCKFLQISCFFYLFAMNNVKIAYFDQRFGCEAPKHWSKCTTLAGLFFMWSLLVHIFSIQGSYPEAWWHIGMPSTSKFILGSMVGLGFKSWQGRVFIYYLTLNNNSHLITYI